MSGRLRRGLVLLALAAAGAQAQPAPEAVPQAAEPLRDEDFGVESRGLELERQVEMYRWRREGEGHVAAWVAGPVDADAPDPDHPNPPLPVAPERWRAPALTLDGHPLPRELVADLRWQPVEPARIRLPPNMAASFQPDAEGLTTVDGAPRIGDLRLRWRERVGRAATGLTLVDGRWAQAGAASPSPAAPAPAAEPAPGGEPPPRGYWAVALLLVVALVVVVAVARTRRR
ncbi:hypothetical protein [Coralloluteibacterium thermophilus]|uniref:DUF3999 family protein n=1 Tax=Coralloluteibacterium thermophilum TaxID=2707049 RepID=A0ABV9NL39_9GAMM